MINSLLEKFYIVKPSLYSEIEVLTSGQYSIKLCEDWKLFILNECELCWVTVRGITTRNWKWKHQRNKILLQIIEYRIRVCNLFLLATCPSLQSLQIDFLINLRI